MRTAKSHHNPRTILPASYPAISGDGYLVCVEREIIPFLAQALDTLLKRRLWETESDFLAARQAILRLKVELMADCGIADRLDEIGVLLALHLRLGALAQADPATLNALFPQLGPRLVAVLAADTGGALADEEQLAQVEPYLREIAEMFGAIS